MAYTCGALTLEDDGYCVRCGRKHTSKDWVAKRKPAPSRERMSRPVVTMEPEPVVFPTFDLGFKTNEPEPETKTIYDAVGDQINPVTIIHKAIQYLNELYGYDLTFRLGRGEKSYCHVLQRVIQLGKKYLEYYQSENGYFCEYKTIKHVINFKKLTGRDCYIQFVLHEYAHYIQYLRGGIKYGSIHNRAFIQAYREVMVKAGVDHFKN
jgi:hypothetical protein